MVSAPLERGDQEKQLWKRTCRSLNIARDMLWVHVWDSVTPAEELLETMSNLIKAGKVAIRCSPIETGK